MGRKFKPIITLHLSQETTDRLVLFAESINARHNIDGVVDLLLREALDARLCFVGKSRKLLKRSSMYK